MIRIILITFLLICSVTFSQELSTYEMFSNHFDSELYTKQFQREFDKNGILIQKKEYHALTISIFGIMCADNFVKTGDSSYYKHVVNQYKYFSDPSKIILFNEGTEAGLPYHKSYNGLKAPWFSGMTQGMAASFLLRYYTLTKDETALDLTLKIVKFLLKPEKEGGAIGKTPEGFLWIEEYPNCKSSKSVLNGFINGLLGLKEYLVFFPNDKYAKEVHDECYSSLFKTLSKYDKPAWSSYNRNGRTLAKHYIRYQLQEFDHLYSIYKDDRFRDQMRIWAMFAHTKNDTYVKYYKKPNYVFAENLVVNKDGECVYDGRKEFHESLLENKMIYSTSKRKQKEIELILGGGSNYFEVYLNGFDLNLKSIVVNDDEEANVSVEITNDTLKIISLTSINKLDIKFKKRKKIKKENIQYSYYDYSQCKAPMFAFVNINAKQKLKKGATYTINSQNENTINGRVYYRTASTSKGLMKAIYSIENSFLLSDDSMTAEKDAFYEFFISYDITVPQSKIVNFKLKEQ